MRRSSVVLFLTAASPLFSQHIRVLVWDERQPQQKRLSRFIGNHIAGLDDPQHGLGGDMLDTCDVVISSPAFGVHQARSPQDGRVQILELVRNRSVVRGGNRNADANTRAPVRRHARWRGRSRRGIGLPHFCAERLPFETGLEHTANRRPNVPFCARYEQVFSCQQSMPGA